MKIEGDKKSVSKKVQPNKTVLKFNSEDTGELDALNNFIKNFKFEKMLFKNYDEYLTIINFLSLRNNHPNKKYYNNELDYLYELKNSNPKKNEKNINKMKEVGKIFTENITHFDSKPPSDKNILFSFNNLKLEGINNFYSILVNNCVSSGKWCYEVTLLTNGLMQIGFCQINTIFTAHGGVGDDISSYAYDGYRKSKWNGNQKDYGKFWDMGDIIGVCIDMDGKSIEYFLNGESLGSAFYNIKKGENVAFFPAVSLRRGESCLFNFGQLPFQYKYKGYQSFDKSLSQINCINKNVNDLLTVWKENILPLFTSDKISVYQNLLLSNDIFKFVSQNLEDLYIFHEVLVPFLIDLVKTLKNEKVIDKVINNIIILMLNNFKDEIKKDKGYYIFEHLSLEINQRALRMGNIKESIINTFLIDFECVVKVFKSCLKCDLMTNILFQKGTLDVLKNVFNCNFFHMGNLIEYLYKKYDKILFTSNAPLNNIIKELTKNVITPNEKYSKKINECISKNFSDLIYLFLTDKRKLYEGKILKDKFNELIRNGYSLQEGNEIVLNILGLGNKLTKQEPIFIRNIFMNLIYMFNENFLNIDFEKITTYPWFYRMNKNDIYYDEVGIGGTISHVTEEYLNLIPEEMKIKNDDFCFDYFHKLMHMYIDIFLNSTLKKFDEFYSKSKTSPISSYFSDIREQGSTKFNNVIKRYFYVFPLVIQNTLYKFAFFVLKFLMYLTKKNKYIIYFIPSNIAEIPFSVFKLLMNLKYFTSNDVSIRLDENKFSKHFKDDDFVLNLIEFYLILFADYKIANPELKESYLNKVNFLLEKQIIEEYFDDDKSIFENLMIGLLKDIQTEALSQSASRIFLKIITPICFGYKFFTKNPKINKKRYIFNEAKNNQIKKDDKYIFSDDIILTKLKEYFNNNMKQLDHFLKDFNCILNNIMTNFSVSLSDIIEIKVSKLKIDDKNNDIAIMGIPTHRGLCQGLSTNYYSLSQILKVYEIIFLIFPDVFLDTEDMNYINMVNAFKILFTRIFNKIYTCYLREIQDFIAENIKAKVLNEKYRMDLYQIGLSMVGIFLNIYKLKGKNEKFEKFCEYLVNKYDLDLKELLDYMDIVKKELSNLKNSNSIEIIKIIETQFKECIDYIMSLKKEDPMIEEFSKCINDANLCILCFENNIDTKLEPCGHTCCHICYKKYKETHRNCVCFICNQEIKSTKKIKPE